MLSWMFMINFLCANDLNGLFFKYEAKKKIDRRVLKVIAKIESKLNPYAICVNLGKSDKNSLDVTMRQLLNNLGVDYKYDKSKRIFSIYPTKKVASKKIIKFLLKKDISNFDVGLMGINSSNIKRLKLDYLKLLEPSENIEVASNILLGCYRGFSNIALTIECYHSGFNSDKFNYRYVLNFYKISKEIL